MLIGPMVPPLPATPVPPAPSAAQVTRTTRGADATRAVGAALGRCLPFGALVTLSGGLGAGKTTFTQGIAAGLGITGRVASPTYTLVHGHALPAQHGEPGNRAGGESTRVFSDSVPVRHLVHADLYRVHSATEARELALDERHTDGDIVIVEWPENADGALGEADVEVTLSEGDGADDAFAPHDRRRIVMRAHTDVGRSILACCEAAAWASGDGA